MSIETLDLSAILGGMEIPEEAKALIQNTISALTNGTGNEQLSYEELRDITRAKAMPTLDKKERQALQYQPLALKKVYHHPVTLVNEKTGEINDTERVIFELNDGQAISFTANAAIEFKNLLKRFNPNLTFDGSLEFIFREVPLKTGSTFGFEVL